ncbi:MAG: 4Fe-4S single cluster domain-containing protein [Pirellulales bacterium]
MTHPMTTTPTIRLGHDLQSLAAGLHNGPGRRIGIWTQGCVHRCTVDCLSPHLLDPAGGRIFSVTELVAAVQRVVNGTGDVVEGVTVLGGEPFEQAGPLAAAIEPLRRLGLSTMVYSGHTYEHLRHSPQPEIHSLLAVTDILVDGPYLPALYSDTLAWRGSTNQRLICLTPRYSPELLEAAFAKQGKAFSLEIGPGTLRARGMQSRPAAAAIEAIFSERSARPEQEISCDGKLQPSKISFLPLDLTEKPPRNQNV